MGKQLYMRAELHSLSEEISLPEGYWIRTFVDSANGADAASWDGIIQESFGANPGFLFDSFIRPEAAFLPERVFFVCHEGKCVATASAWRYSWLEEGWGGIHMVGALPAHGGKGLGKAVSKAAMLRLKAEGCRWAWLTTDDFRLAAVKSYLDLGFQPVIVEEGQWERWERVFQSLKRPWDPDRAYVRLL